MSSFYSPETLQMVREMTMGGAKAYDIGLTLPGVTKELTYLAIRHRGQRAVEAARRVTPVAKGLAPPTDNTSTTEDTHSVTRITDKQITTLEELLAFCKVDTEVWEVDRWVCNSWGMGYKDPLGKGKTHPLYQVKATFRRRVAYIAHAQSIREAIADLMHRVPASPCTDKVYQDAQPLLWVLSIPDLHLGKLAWPEESGESYNIEVAFRVYKQAFSELLEDASSRRIGKIIFPIGNDLMNFDNLIGTTTAGTPQKQGQLYQQVFSAALELMCWSIDQLLHIAPVEVISVPGNHDAQSAWTLTECVRAYYRASSAVRVDNSPKLRKTIVWGSVGIMYTHGKEEKLASLPLIMMRENHGVWSSLKVQEVHLGHLHRSAGMRPDYEEIHGVMVRILPSLCATDSWHSSKGYVGNTRSAQSYYYHASKGYVGSAVSNIL